MAQYKADFIRVPTGPTGFQTMPVDPEKRLPDADISIRLCDEHDAEKIVRQPISNTQHHKVMVSLGRRSIRMFP